MAFKTTPARDQDVTGDVETSIGGHVVNTNQTPFQRMIRHMEMDATMDVEEGRFSGDDLNEILSAETEEDLWAAGEAGPLNAQHLAGCELALTDLQVKYSRGESDIATPFVSGDGKKMYFLITAHRISDAGEKAHLRLPKVGQDFQFNTSARFLAAKVWMFYSRGYFGGDSGKSFECAVHETDLGGGTGVLKIRPIPTRATRTETSE
jgi:hypothetical protein